MDKFTEKLIEYLNSSEIFLKQQAPDFVNQFVAYEAWHVHFIFYVWFSIFASMVLFQTVIVILAWIDFSEMHILGSIFASAIGILTGLATVDSYSDLRKIEMAPKVFLVERATKMLAVCK